MTIHNPIIINCEGVNRHTGCPTKAQYRPKSIVIQEARKEALNDGGWMWNPQTGDLCDECSTTLLVPLLSDDDD